jgi:hypothetical protein
VFITRFLYGAVLADLDAEVDETPHSRLDPEPASPALESVEAKADNGKNDNARKYSQHNGTLQPLHSAGLTLADWFRPMDSNMDPCLARCCVLVCRCGCLYCASRVLGSV